MSSITSIAAPKTWKELPRHELSALYGDMSECELQMVKTDMVQAGFRGRSVLLYEGAVLDGWHQLTAAAGTGCQPAFEDFKGTAEEAFDEAWRRNGARRHYSESQRAMVGARVTARRRGRPGEEINSANLRNLCNLPSTEEIAKTLNVSSRSIETARAVIANGTPWLQDAVVNGTITVSDAAKIVGAPAKVQNQAVSAVVNGHANTASAAVNGHLNGSANGKAPRREKTPAETSKERHADLGRLARYGDDLAKPSARCAGLRDQFHAHLQSAKDELTRLEKAAGVL